MPAETTWTTNNNLWTTAWTTNNNLWTTASTTWATTATSTATSGWYNTNGDLYSLGRPVRMEFIDGAWVDIEEEKEPRTAEQSLLEATSRTLSKSKLALRIHGIQL